MKGLLSGLLSVFLLLACVSVRQPCALAEAAPAAAAPKSAVVPLDETMFRRDGLTVTAETLRYTIGETVELDIAVQNDGAKAIGFSPYKVYLNGWYTESEWGIEPVSKGDTVRTTVRVLGVDTEAFAKMQILEIQTVRLTLALFNAAGGFTREITTDLLVNPAAEADYVQTYDDSGTVLLDDASIKIVQHSVDDTNRTACLYLEKKETSRWTEALIDVVYNGYRAFHSSSIAMEKGMRAYLELDGNEIYELYGIDSLSSVDLYLTFYHSSTLKDPIHLKLENLESGSTVAAARTGGAGKVLFENEACILRYIGVSDGYFSDSEVFLLECENKTADKNLSIYLEYGYILLDGQRCEAYISGVNCYPNSISPMALYTLAPIDLSACSVLETTLGVYQIKGGYHQPLDTTGILTVRINQEQSAA